MATSAYSVSAGQLDIECTDAAALLLRAARLHPESGLIIASGERNRDIEPLSYPMLLEEARHIQGGLQARAGAPRAGIVLLLEPARDFIPAFWACLLGGYIPCPLAPIRNDADRWAKHLAHVDALLGQPLFVSVGEALPGLPASLAVADIEDLRKSPPALQTHRAGLTDTAVLMLTSGSTGNSKAVELTHGNLLASMEGRAERQRLTAADIMFNWIAFDHVAALLESHMIALSVGAGQLHTAPATILADPMEFLNLIDRQRVSVAFAPNFLLGQVNAALQQKGGQELARRAPALNLSCLRRIVTGGEANVVETGRRFLALLAPYGLAANALWPAFGMTETCAASVYSDGFPDCDAHREFASVGMPIQGLEIRIVDEHGARVSEGATGELQVQGAVIFPRYHNNVEATRAAFTSDGWFRTGDLGRIEDGRLCLVARSKDSIIVNGVNYFSHELEAQLEQLAGVERSFVAAFPTRPRDADTEQLVITFATTLSPSDEDGLYQLVVAVRDTTIMLWGFRPALIVPLQKGSFPKTSLGKIQRSLMRKRFEAGDFNTDIEQIGSIISRRLGERAPILGPVEEALGSIFSDIFRLDISELSATESFFDLGGTSLDILKLTQALQRNFGLRENLPLVLQNPTIRGLAAQIDAQNRQELRKYDPIVPLQVRGKRTPLFCVHPGNGEIFVLVNVAKYFVNDRPFYAFRPPGFDEGEECFNNVEQIVAAYVNAILLRQPRGPYAIAGYSLGCWIAFEIAKELEARGREVAFLGCIDWVPRCEVSPIDFNMATGLALVLDLISLDQYEALNRELSPACPDEKVCEYVLTFASPRRLVELNLDPHKFRMWSRVAYSMESLLLTHPTRGKVRTMTVFCSEGFSSRYTREEGSRVGWLEQLRRWDEFAVQTRYIEVPGDHHTLMGPKHAAAFQSLLRSEIDRALGER